VGDVGTLTWAGIYSQGWGRGLLHPTAYSHPAKFAYGLLTRLYDHGFARGWWRKGDLVADPFGGVGCGGVVAAYRGLRWVGVELEPRFVALAEETFALHRGKWAAAGDVPPLILQGDSRNFAAVVACVTSPAWVDPRERPPQDAQGDSRQFAAPAAGAAGVITSPPYAAQVVRPGGRDPGDLAGLPVNGDTRRGRVGPAQGHYLDAYGTTPGQLGALPAGDADSVVTSPPYADSDAHPSLGSVNKDAWGSDGRKISARRGLSDDYGTTPGQFGALPAGDVGAVVTSPPYEGSNQRYEETEGCRERLKASGEPKSGCGLMRGRASMTEGYGTAPGQVGALRQETYWDAVRCIYGQCLLALKPGGVACVVIKDFVRAKKRVPLCDQTWRLLLSLGFTPVERIRCLLSEETREPSLFGGCEVKKRSRVSFFRRLAEKKGSPPIDAEEILVVRRPPAGVPE
jgi:hypothetical protein